MQKQAIIDEQQEQIRRQVRELSDEKRRSYYALVEKKLKDPDTYATLNYIFIAGLHHFYLGKWMLGIINIVVFWGGVAAIFFNEIELGVALIAGIIIFELYELFQSQKIVQDYNNNASQDVIQSLSETDSTTTS